MPSLWEAVYTSALREDAPEGTIAAIVRTARRHNQLNGITGILVFDGQLFCQYLEGAPQVVQSLLQRIAADRRHRDFTLHHEGALHQRRFESWSMAYGLDGEGVIARLQRLPGQVIPAALFDALLQLDLEPGLAI